MDGMRAIAALTVLTTHAAIVSGAINQAHWGNIVNRLEIGVALFFLLSGFLLYRPFVASRYDGRPRPRLRKYARRRALRIVPAYWFALTVLTLLLSLPGVFTHDWWVYYGFAQIYRPEWVLGGIKPAWSLCVEVSFYLTLPLFAIALDRWLRGRHPRRQLQIDLAVLASLAAVSLGLRWELRETAALSQVLATIAGHLEWFAAGMALAVVAAAAPHVEEARRVARWVAAHPLICWFAAIAAYGVLCLIVAGPRPALVHGKPGLVYGPNEDVARHFLYGFISLLALAPAAFAQPGESLVARVLGSRLLGWLGLVSYGVFLWHLPLLEWLSRHGGQTWLPQIVPATEFVALTLSSFALATTCAAISWYAVERPFQALRDRPLLTGRRAREP